MLSVKVFILIMLINGVPPILSLLLPEKASRPLDNDLKFLDGRPLLGNHKTVRGFFGGIAAGGIFGVLLGFPLPAALMAGLLGMGGDCVTSFFKRRLRLAGGTDLPAADQLLECGLPLLFLAGQNHIPWPHITVIFLTFMACGHLFSRFRKELLNSCRSHSPRLVRSAMRFREWRACHIALSPLARLMNFENVILYRWFMAGAFRFTGLYPRGRANALDVRRRYVTLPFPSLPESFDGYRLLFMSDLHLDGLPGLTERLADLVSDLEVDLCLLGGDYRMEMYGRFCVAKRSLGKLVRSIRTKDGVFGILGNHDCLAITPELEDSGIYMLINDAYTIHRGDAKLCIAGVDDPHYYKCHDLDTTFREVPPDAFTILLAHSPEIVLSADGRRVDLCLCGHTHGGQVCLPSIGPVFTHCKAPRKLAAGLWNHGTITGFTSRGAGSSGVPVRFNCPPEIVIITLSR